MKVRKIKRKNLISAWQMTFIVLAIWIISALSGVWITRVINTHFPVEEEVKNFSIVIAFVLGSTLIALPITYLITSASMKVTLTISECIDRIAEGDFTTQMPNIGKNEYVNAVVNNFNKMVQKLNTVSIINSDFISSFSHEFKTPIVSIKGYAELLKESGGLNKEQIEYLDIIIEESKRLTKLSESTLLISKLDSQKVMLKEEEFYVKGQIENTILLFDSQLKEKNIELETTLKRVKIKSDPDFIKEIWINLISNAIKYSNNGGKIQVSMKSDKNNLFVTVSDNGIGMDKETKEKAFEKFYQKEKSHSMRGLGLGLSIVKRIVDLAGGEITCESELNKGTRITVMLPKNT